MKKNIMKLVAIASIMVMAFAMTSCGGNDGALTVEDGKLHMATNAAFPPYEMTTDDGSFEGIDVEIAQAIAEELGLELVVDDMDFSSVLTSVQGGKSDIAMAGLTVTDERKENVDFTSTYATGVQSIIVKEGSSIKSVDDLDGAKIGCQEGTTGYIYCSDDYGEDNVISYTNGAMAVEALKAGKVDVNVTSYFSDGTAITSKTSEVTINNGSSGGNLSIITEEDSTEGSNFFATIDKTLVLKAKNSTGTVTWSVENGSGKAELPTTKTGTSIELKATGVGDVTVKATDDSGTVSQKIEIVDNLKACAEAFEK